MGSFKAKRFGYHGDSKGTAAFSNLGYNRGCTSAGTTATKSQIPHSDSDDAAVPLDAPERLAIATPYGVALGGGYIIWTELPGEFCSPEGAVKTVNLTTRAVRTLRSS